MTEQWAGEERVVIVHNTIRVRIHPPPAAKVPGVSRAEISFQPVATHLQLLEGSFHG